MSAKKRIKRPIQIKDDKSGAVYSGERVIEGTRKLDQYVCFNDLCKADLHGYRPSDVDGIMLVVAKMMLSELVNGKTMGAYPREKFKL